MKHSHAQCSTAGSRHRLLSLFLTLAMFCSLMTGISLPAKAYTAKTADEALYWAKQQVGQSLDIDGAGGAQCVDLIMAYYQTLGVSWVNGSGGDYTWNPLPDGWQRFQGIQPEFGDILVYTGGVGHVAIYESDTSHYHQNVNGHQYVEHLDQRYDSFPDPHYWGVIRPDFNRTKPEVTWDSFNVTPGDHDASMSVHLQLDSTRLITEVGVKVWNSDGEQVAESHVNPRVLQSEYTLSVDSLQPRIDLVSGTQYTCQFYVNASGYNTLGPVESFITTGEPPAPPAAQWEYLTCVPTEIDVALSATAMLNGTYALSSCGFTIWDEAGNVAVKYTDPLFLTGEMYTIASDSVVADCGKYLQDDTPYTYQFFIVADGVTITSDIRSFRTKSFYQEPLEANWDNVVCTPDTRDAALDVSIQLNRAVPVTSVIVQLWAGGSYYAQYVRDIARETDTIQFTLPSLVNACTVTPLEANSEYGYSIIVNADGTKLYSAVQYFNTLPESSPASAQWALESCTPKDDDAYLAANATLDTQRHLTRAGIELWDAEGSPVQHFERTLDTYADVYYFSYPSLRADCGFTLIPGTDYTFKFYVEADGVTLYSPENSFRTTGTKPLPPSADWTYHTCQPGLNDAVLGASADFGRYFDVEYYGLRLFRADGSLIAEQQKTKYDYTKRLNMNISSVSEFLGISLEPDTEYSYQFFVFAENEELFGPEEHFRTAAVSANSWTQPLTISDWTYGQSPAVPQAQASYGEPRFSYSSSPDGPFTAEPPTQAGRYYVKASVEETPAYTGLEDIIFFTISPKRVEDAQISPLDETTDLSTVTVTVDGAELVQGRDYRLSTAEQDGTVLVTFAFMGNYTGTLTRSYEISRPEPQPEPEPELQHGWILDSIGWRYYGENGQPITDCWMADSHGWVYLDSQGYMVKNAWVMDSHGPCYVGSDGYVVTSTWCMKDGNWVFVDAEGHLLTNCWMPDSRGWVYLDGQGLMVKNAWVMDSHGPCYAGSDGYVVTNAWLMKDGKEVYTDADGHIAADVWLLKNDQWVKTDAQGYLITNCWMADSRGWVFLGSQGYMLRNTWVLDSQGWCFVGDDGYIVTNAWRMDSQGWCYLDGSGHILTDCWMLDSIGWCYLGSDGRMVRNQYVNDSRGPVWIGPDGYVV